MAEHNFHWVVHYDLSLHEWLVLSLVSSVKATVCVVPCLLVDYLVECWLVWSLVPSFNVMVGSVPCLIVDLLVKHWFGLLSHLFK
jgi:hypothetical protein